MYALLKSGEIVRLVTVTSEGEGAVGIKEKVLEDRSNVRNIPCEDILEYDSNLHMLQMRSEQIHDGKSSDAYIISFHGKDPISKCDITKEENTFFINDLTEEEIVKAYRASFFFHLNPELSKLDYIMVDNDSYVYLNDVITDIAKDIVENYNFKNRYHDNIADIVDTKDNKIIINVRTVKKVKEV